MESARGGVEFAREGVESARGGVEFAREGVECARGGVECARRGVEAGMTLPKLVKTWRGVGLSKV